MKIGQPPEIAVTGPQSNATAPQKTGQGSNAPATASVSASDSTRSAGVAVTVSTMARGLEKTGRGQSAEVDAEKVAATRAAIQDGTYVVNPEAIADKLLSNAQELLNRSTS